MHCIALLGAGIYFVVINHWGRNEARVEEGRFFCLYEEGRYSRCLRGQAHTCRENS